MGTVIGKYMGNGMTTGEFGKIYGPGGHQSVTANKFAFTGAGQLLLDPFLGNSSNIRNEFNVTMFANDCRQNIREKATESDLKRQNADFLWVVVNRRLELLLIAMRNIKKGAAVLVNYDTIFDCV